MSFRILIAVFSCTVAVWTPSGQASEIRTDFSSGLAPWVPIESGRWEIQTENGNAVAALVEPGTQRPPVRRPTGALLLKDQQWSNVRMSLRAKTLEPAATINRDVVLIFGYVDDTHFYYAHISSNADDRFHNIIMKVEGDTRHTIHRETLPEPRLSDGWHDLRVEHDKSGAIRVFVDDMDTPLMTAEDTSYPAGAVGFGCFDDRALFDDVVVAGDVQVASSELMNISTRGLVGTGPDIMIAGFVLEGTSSRSVLIRAAGPALAYFGVSGAVEDPALALYSSSSETEIGANDNWEDAPNATDIAAAAESVGAFAFASGSQDAAMLVTLDPGQYTAHVTGQTGGGQALVEVYSVSM